MIKEIKLKSDKILTIRRVEEGDAKKLIEYLNLVGGESDFLLFGRDEFEFSVDQERDFIKNFNNQKNSIMLIGEIDGEIVSTSQVNAPDKPRICHNGDLAISVRKDFWELGIGKIVMNELIEFAKNTGVIRLINLQVHQDNIRGQNLYQKMGFQEIGRYKKHICIDNKYYDSIIMGLYFD